MCLEFQKGGPFQNSHFIVHSYLYTERGLCFSIYNFYNFSTTLKHDGAQDIAFLLLFGKLLCDKSADVDGELVILIFMMHWQCFNALNKLSYLVKLVVLFAGSVGAAVQRESKQTVLFDEYQGQVQICRICHRLTSTFYTLRV